MIHELKTHPIPFRKVKSGIKTFELRKNDRDFRVGDELLLKEFTPADYWEDGEPEGYTGEFCHRRVVDILQDTKYGILEGYVIMSISSI